MRNSENFRKYAWPLSSEVYVLWDNAPAEWSPQNHSCNPNTEYAGLNVIAVRIIAKGEELTLDYTTFSMMKWKVLFATAEPKIVKKLSRECKKIQ